VDKPECGIYTDCIAELAEEQGITDAADDVGYWELTQKLAQKCKICTRNKGMETMKACPEVSR